VSTPAPETSPTATEVDETWPTATEVAARAGCGTDTVLRAIRRGQLRGQLLAGRNGAGIAGAYRVYHVDPADAERWIAARRLLRK
jgi:hypothetical protein